MSQRKSTKSGAINGKKEQTKESEFKRRKKSHDKVEKKEDIKLFSILIIIIIMILSSYFIYEKQSTNNENIDYNDDLKETGRLVKEIKITADQWNYNPNLITVNKGDTVKLILSSSDVAHGFSLPEYNINVYISETEAASVEFVADKEGTFTYSCSVHCGSGHGNMRGTLKIT
jgi:cytochrome c oxidase subunit 2